MQPRRYRCRDTSRVVGELLAYQESGLEGYVNTKQPKDFFCLRYLIGAVLLALTLFFALAPGVFSPLRPLTNDWIPSLALSDARMAAHVFGFAGLVVVMSWVTQRVVAGVVVVFVLAMSIELIQVFLPWRDGTWSDVGLNFIALGLGFGIAWFLGIGKRPGQ